MYLLVNKDTTIYYSWAIYKYVCVYFLSYAGTQSVAIKLLSKTVLEMTMNTPKIIMWTAEMKDQIIIKRWSLQWCVQLHVLYRNCNQAWKDLRQVLNLWPSHNQCIVQ